MKNRTTLHATLVYVFRNGYRDGQVLLGEKLALYCRGKLVGPGGKLEPGESAYACAMREMKEETGVKPILTRPIGILLAHNCALPDILVYIYRTGRIQGQPRDSEKLTHVKWYPVNRTTIAKMMPGDRLWFRHLYQNRPFFAEIWHDRRWRVTQSVIRPLDPPRKKR